MRVGVPAGVAVVEEVAPEWFCRRRSSPPFGVAPWELRRGSAVLPSSAAPRSAREGSPFAGVHGMVVPVVDDMEGEVAEDQGGVAVGCAWWRYSGTEER